MQMRMYGRRQFGPPTCQEGSPEVISEKVRLGIQYKCKLVNKNIVMRLLALITIVGDEKGIWSFLAKSSTGH